MNDQKKQNMKYYFKTMPSPVGKLRLVASDQGLAAILWEKDDPKRVRQLPASEDKGHPILLETECQLKDYFDGKLQAFTVPLDPVGTPFQKKVWEELAAIPFGETVTYGQLANKFGNPNLSRAVGGANRRNPISIIAACHRVIGSTGDLTGYAGGLDTKAFLLTLEGNRPRKPARD
jgi:methylated-DNA-[protein]-cysteine S-methyltransferase